MLLNNVRQCGLYSIFNHSGLDQADAEYMGDVIVNCGLSLPRPCSVLFQRTSNLLSRLKGFGITAQATSPVRRFQAFDAPNIHASFTPEALSDIYTSTAGLFDEYMLPDATPKRDEESRQLQKDSAKQESKNIRVLQQTAKLLDQGKSVLESQVLDEMPNLSSDGLEARAELSVRKAEKEVLEQKAQAEEEVRGVLLLCLALAI